MKTLEEVKAHFKNVGYRHQDMPKVEGFLFGKGLFEGDEFEIEFMCGERDFYDFKNWFNDEEQEKEPIDWDEFEYGDMIHVQEGIDAMLLGHICDGKFVCFNGDVVCVFSLTDESRPCNDDELEEFDKHLRNRGILVSYGFREFNPMYKDNACNERIKERRAMDVNHNDELDKLEIEAKNAVENIVASIHANELDPHEKELVLGTLEALVILGNEYE